MMHVRPGVERIVQHVAEDDAEQESDQHERCLAKPESDHQAKPAKQLDRRIRQARDPQQRRWDTRSREGNYVCVPCEGDNSMPNAIKPLREERQAEEEPQALQSPIALGMLANPRRGKPAVESHRRSS